MAIPVEHKKVERRGVLLEIGQFVRPVLLTALLIVAFWSVLTGMYQSWFQEYAYMEHGVLVLPAALYMAWTQREKLRTIPRSSSALGVLVLAWGSLQAMLGVAAHWVWVSRISVLIAFVGALAVSFGWRMVRTLAYPLGTLVLMVAPPTFLFDWLTLSLQLLASRLGERFLEALGYSVFREGNILHLVNATLSVEEACSGIRSLMAILFMCVLYNYFFVEGRPMRILILVMSIPIAILGNACRIVATGVASQYNHALITGTAHETFGYISVTIAAIGCMSVHILLLSIQRGWRSHHA
jgi:exosortase